MFACCFLNAQLFELVFSQVENGKLKKIHKNSIPQHGLEVYQWRHLNAVVLVQAVSIQISNTKTENYK